MTSSWIVSIPSASKWAILLRLRADAKTRRPSLWKALARPSPIPPSEQPVMRTVFRGAIEFMLTKLFGGLAIGC